MNESIVADSELRFYRLIPPSMFSIPISPKKSPAPICFSTSPESLHIDEFAFVVEKYRSRQSFVPASQIYHNNKKKCGRRVRPTRYAPPACNDTGTALGQDGSDWSRYLATLTFDLRGHSWRLWLMQVVAFHPYTKFEVRRPCRSEDMAHDVYEH